MIDHLLEQDKLVSRQHHGAFGLRQIPQFLRAALRLFAPVETPGPASAHLRYDCGESDLREADRTPAEAKLAAYAASFDAMSNRRI